MMTKKKQHQEEYNAVFSMYLFASISRDLRQWLGDEQPHANCH